MQASSAEMAAGAPETSTGGSNGATFLIRTFDRFLPDPYVIAVLLTVLTWALAAVFAPRNDVQTIIGGWYKGSYDIGSFAFLVALMLVTGYTLSVSKPVSAGLQWLASISRSPFSAVCLAIIVTTVISLLHWAVALTVAGLLAKEISKKLRLDLAWLVAAAYSGFGLFSSGLSCSVQLISAMHGPPLNIVERITGYALPLTETVFAAFLAIVLPGAFYLVRPPVVFNNAEVAEEKVWHSDKRQECRVGLAGWLERSIWLNLIIVTAVGANFVMRAVDGHFELDFTTMVAIFFALGLLLHGSPRAYIAASGEAARQLPGFCCNSRSMAVSWA